VSGKGGGILIQTPLPLLEISLATPNQILATLQAHKYPSYIYTVCIRTAKAKPSNNNPNVLLEAKFYIGNNELWVLSQEARWSIESNGVVSKERKCVYAIKTKATVHCHVASYTV
jgi:hypothetical protein